MRFNKYTLLIPNDNKVILYNLITKVLIEYDGSLETIEKDFFRDLTEDEIIYYKDRLLISDDENDDKSEMKKIKYDYNYQNKIGHFVIHLGYACNLQCDYCYQTTIHKDKKTQILDVAAFLDFFHKVSEINKFEDYDICFLGGEPLLFSDQILEIVKYINKNKINGNIYYSVITNGTLLDDNHKLSELISNGVNEFQITLDGLREQHDKHRKSKSGGSFEKIVNNIKIINKKYPDVSIMINYNISRDNYDGIEDLFSYLRNTSVQDKIGTF